MTHQEVHASRQYAKILSEPVKTKQLDLFERATPKQLWLLNFKNPLKERFGAAFFSNLPTSPGVYIMKNSRDEVIYVGKAKNLRARLRSYTGVNPDNSSRKVLRLVQTVQSIEWEELKSEKAALLRENELLRAFAPDFNVVNTAPETYLFAHLKNHERGLIIHFAMNVDPDYPDVYGAFKGLGVCYRMHKAILRLLWLTYNECRNGFELPGALTNHKKLRHHVLALPKDIDEKERRALYSDLKRLFNGTSKRFLEQTVQKLLERTDLAGFMSEFIQADIDACMEFHERCAKRNRKIRNKLQLSEKLLDQEKLDDYLVQLRFD